MTGPPPGAGDALDRFDVISQMLDVVRLDGALFLRAQFRAPWAYESPPADHLMPLLGPDTKRLVLFHIIVEGACSVAMEGVEGRLPLAAGDVVMFPYGDQHIVGDAESTPPVPIGELLTMPPWSELNTIEYGGDGDPTVMVCGYLRCGDLLFDPVLRALPPVFSVTPPPGPAAAWVNASVDYALAASAAGGPWSTSQRLPELLFVEMLRAYLEDADRSVTGWLAALRDPVVGPALAALHRDPARVWTVAELAREAATSRSALDDRFRQLLGRPPIRYLTDWRFSLASGLLRTTDLSVGEIAARVGYSAEEAFSRAFKREFGEPPARWRAQARAISSPGP